MQTLPVSLTTVGEVYSAYPPISSVTALTSAVIAQAYMGPTEAFILGKVAKLYPIAGLISNLPPVLHAIATRETIYRISLSRLMSQFPPSQTGKATIQVMHDEDMKLLDAIRDGDMTLLDSSLQVIDPTLGNVEIWSSTQDYNPTFHEGDWTEMVQDTDKLDDIEDVRDGRGL